MKDITAQLKDWKQLKKVLEKSSKSDSEAERRMYRGQFYEGVKMYWETYNEKFDFLNPPKSI